MAVSTLFGFALLARVTVALILPPWQAPDEPRHFEYARLLVEKRQQLWSERRPIRYPDDISPQLQISIIESMARNHFWEYTNRRPPAALPATFVEVWQASPTELRRTYSPYPYLGALVLLPFERLPLEDQLRIVRLISAVLSALTVVVTYLAARELAPTDPFVSVVAAGFVATLPMHIFMGGVVNADNLATLLGSLIMLGLASGLRRGFSTRRWALIGVATLVALVAKRTGFALAPAVLLSAVGVLAARPARIFLLTFGAVAALCAAVAIAVVPAIPPLRESTAALNDYFLNEPDQVVRLFDGRLASPDAWALVGIYLRELYASFWGVFGWYSLKLAPRFYDAFAILGGVAALGLVLHAVGYLRQAMARPTPISRRTLALALVYPTTVATLVAFAVGERLSYFEPWGVPQGRYVFIGIAPIGALFALGIRAFLPSCRLGTWTPTLIAIAAFVVLDVAVFLHAFLPFYVARSFA